MTSENSCYILTCHVKLYIYKEKQRQRNRSRETQRLHKKANRKEVWLNFHIRYRGENIAKGLPPFGKNWRSMQILKHLKNK